MMLYLSHREKRTRVLGPGLRYVLWVQGCKKRCPGCVFPDGQIIGENGYWMTAENILEELESDKELTGITISGGEPFLQSEGLAALIRLIRQRTQLDIMLYSGYTLEELRGWDNGYVDFILANSDLLIDGEYRENQNNNTIYRGSDNQVIHFLSDKYKKFSYVMNNTKNRSLEFVFRNGELFVVGIPEKGFQKKFWQTMENLK